MGNEKTVEEIESNDETKKRERENRDAWQGCLIGLIILLVTCGPCVYFVSTDKSWEQREAREAVEFSVFKEEAKEWAISSVDEKPAKALALHLKYKDLAERFYEHHKEFRKSTNRGIRLLKIADPEEFIEFCRDRQTLEACK